MIMRCLYLSVSPQKRKSIYFNYVWIYLFFNIYIYLFIFIIYLFIHLSIHLLIHLFIYLFIYLFTHEGINSEKHKNNTHARTDIQSVYYEHYYEQLC